MSKRRREKSPVSEDTLINGVVSCGVRFIDEDSTVVDQLFEDDSGEDEDEYEPADDTDEDPDFFPEEDMDQHEEEYEDDPEPQPTTSSCRPRPRGRPRSTNLSNTNDGENTQPTRRRRRENDDDDKDIYNVQWPINESDATAGWKIFSEENDPGNETVHQFFEQPGPRHCPPHNARPIDYFNLFFTQTLLTTFVTQTNLYASNYIQTLTPSSLKWSPVTLSEIKAFLAIILNMGLYKRPTIDSYWRTKSKSQCLPWFGEMSSRNRFETILRFFHMTDSSALPKPGEANYDPCARFSLLIEHANRVFRRHYVPHRELSVDESLIGTKCHTSMTQYLPNKHHHKWGIKLWMICDSVTNYCLGFFCYKGKKDDEGNENKQQGLAYRVVVKLMEMGQYLNKGYHIFVDNFFMSIPLARYLFSKETYITGTVRRNRQEIPNRIKENLGVGQQCYMRNESLLMLSYRQKKSQKNPVILLSTKYKANTVNKTKRRNNSFIESKKPEMIDKYNMYMGGIDTSDQMLYCYLDERRTLKYWRKVTFNIIARMVLNSYLLYKENNSGKILSRYDFTAEIIDELAEEWLASRNGNARPMGGGDGIGQEYGMDHLPGRLEKNCSVCSPLSTANGGPRKRSRYCCKKCLRGIHPLCFGQHRC